MITLDKALGSIAVIDIETAPDPEAVSMAPRGGPANRPALHRVAAFSVLSATESADGEWTALGLETRAGDDEYEMLFDLDAILDGLRTDQGTIVTYNGQAWDLPILRRRTIVNWLFALPGLAALPDLPHLDLMREEMRRGKGASLPSLRDLCAATGIPTNHLLANVADETTSVAHRKSQVDVAATFLLMAHELSARRGNSRTVSRAWLALSELLNRREFRQPHLAQFARHPTVERAREERD